MNPLVPHSELDPAFQRRIGQLIQAEASHGRDSRQYKELHAAEWVTERPFDPADDRAACPLRHPGPHQINANPEWRMGLKHMRRRCLICSSQWLEPLP